MRRTPYARITPELLKQFKKIISKSSNQKEAARACGISETSVSKIQNGFYDVPNPYAVKIETKEGYVNVDNIQDVITCWSKPSKSHLTQNPKSRAA